MKKMLRMALMAAAMFMAVTTVAKAQGGGGGRGRGMNPVPILKDSLKVSDAVAAKADSIFKAYQTEVAPLMEAARGGDADARAKMTAARTKMTADIKALLTDEQKTKFDALMPAGPSWRRSLSLASRSTVLHDAGRHIVAARVAFVRSHARIFRPRCDPRPLMRGEFLDLSGARLYYYAAGTRGAGDPVVFMHGFPTSGHLWNDVVPLVPAGHRIVVLDLLGYGRSDRPLARAVDVRAHAERVVELLDELRIQRACIVGHGIGGGIAQSLAIRHAERVSSLCLVDSVAFDRWPTIEGRIARATLPVTRFFPPRLLLAILRRDLQRGYGDPDRAQRARSISTCGRSSAPRVATRSSRTFAR